MMRPKGELHTRRGHFRIPLTLVQEHAGLVVALLRDALVVRCELLYDPYAFDYHALSPSFAQVEEGDRAPTYGVDEIYRLGEWVDYEGRRHRESTLEAVRFSRGHCARMYTLEPGQPVPEREA